MTPEENRRFRATVVARAFAEQSGASPQLIDQTASTVACILGDEKHLALAMSMLTQPEQAHVLAGVPSELHAAFRRKVVPAESQAKAAMKSAVERINARTAFH